MTDAEARARFTAARVARLATVTPDGRPHIVPIAFAVSADTVYSAVDAKPKRTTALARLTNIAAQPAATVLADHYEEDWSALWWVRGDGSARVLSGAADYGEIERASDLLAARYPQQRITGAMLALDVARWRGWSASG